MKTHLQRIASGTGFIMLISLPTIEAHPMARLAWLAIAVLLLLAGRAFVFQQKQ